MLSVRSKQKNKAHTSDVLLEDQDSFCDEATSALDSTTEAEILNALRSLAYNRTAIFIAHRLTTALQCDEIIVLEKGRVVEQGPHDVLLSKSGRYSQLWSQQNSTVDAVDVKANQNLVTGSPNVKPIIFPCMKEAETFTWAREVENEEDEELDDPSRDYIMNLPRWPYSFDI
ncbi:hypothetical protein OROGR_019739 [Orobanche gracilis]